jgi:Flp pilus assembly secretin CpaC
MVETSFRKRFAGRGGNLDTRQDEARGAFQTLLTIPAESVSDIRPGVPAMRRPARHFLVRTSLALLVTMSAATVDAATRVSVGVNQSLRMGVAGQAGNVVVGNAAIADVTVVDSHSVIVQGKGYGSTQIMVLDINGRVLLDSIVTVTAPSEGQMTLYRGSTPRQFSCSPRCELDSSSRGGSGANASGPGG